MDIAMQNKQPQIPSWESYEFIKHGNIGVSLYTGTVNYSIPIFTYKDKDFEIPITINYATNGFRVNHKSGILGHGWTLGGPGIITREIKGIPDESTEETFGGISSTIGTFEGYNFYNKSYILSGFASGKNGGIYPGKYKNNMILDGCETTPDLYSFNFCGYRGTFERDYNGKFKLFNMSSQSMGIEIIELDEKYNIYIIDNKGYRYIFERDEYYKKNKDENSQDLDIGENITLRWHLKSITAPNNRRITFNYSPMSESRFEYNYYPQINYYFSFYPYQSAPIDNFTQTITSQKTFYCILQNINFPDNTKLYFEYKDGKDEYYLYNSSKHKAIGKNHRLDNIKIVKNDKIKKSCKFDYSYNTSETNTDNCITFLKRIRISGEGAYQFEYNSMHGYPFLGTTEYDHWGYYNGKGMGFPLSGFIDYIEYDNAYNEIITGNIKRPLYEAALSGTLNKITYPTGGYSCLSYEPHTYSKYVTRDYSTLFMPELSASDFNNETGGVRIKSITTFSSDSILAETIDYEYTLSENMTLSSGILINCPRYGIEYNVLSNNNTPKHVTYYNMSNYIYDYNSTHIEYSRVSVKKSGCGRIDYEYTTSYDYPDILYSKNDNITLPYGTIEFFQSNSYLENIFTPLGNQQLKRGNLLSESFYDNNGHLVKKNINTYSFPLVYTDTILCMVGETAKKVFFSRHNMLLKSTTVNEYSNNTFVSKTTNYTYNKYGLPKAITETASNGDKLKILNYYVNDTTAVNDIFQNMKNNRIFKDIIKQELYRINGDDSILLSSTKYDFYNPDKTNLMLVRPIRTMEFIKGYGWKNKSYFQYDTIGNLIEETDIKGVSKTYLWGYNNCLMISMIENATSAEVNAALIKANISLTNLKNNTDVPDADFKKLQTLSTFLPHAMINLYRYEPFAGITEIIQPNSLKTFYSYDGYGRLSEIRDNNSHVTEQYEYNSVTLPGLSSDFFCNSIYYKNSKLELILYAEGGSGNYSHEWVIKDADGNTVYEYGNDTIVFNADLRAINLTSRKQYIIECKTTDLISKEVSTISKTFLLKAVPLYYQDISENIDLNTGTAIKTATLTADGSDIITFSLDALSGGGICTITIGNKSYTYSGKKVGVEITAQVNSGNTEVSIKLEDSFAETEVILSLISAENHEISSPDCLTIAF